MKGYRNLFGYRGFGRLLGIFEAGYVNVEISYLTLAAVIGVFTLNPLWFGVIALLRSSPRVFFSSLSGYWCDKYSPSRVLFYANLAGAGAFFLMGALGGGKMLNLRLLAAMCFIISACAVSHPIASNAALGNIVSKNDNLAAQTLFEAGFNFAGIIGAPIAGIIINSMGIYHAFYIQGAILLLTAFLAWKMRARKKSAVPPTSMGEGARFILKGASLESRILLSLGVFTAWSFGCLMTVYTQAPFYFLTALKLNAKTAGYLFSAASVFIFLISWGAKPLMEKMGAGKTLLMSGLSCAIAILIFSATTSLAWLLIALVLGAVGCSAIKIAGNNLCHILSPQKIRGSVLGVYGLFGYAGISAGIFLFSWAAKDFGYQKSYLGTGGISLLGIFIYYMTPLKNLRVRPQDFSVAPIIPGPPEAAEPC